MLFGNVTGRRTIESRSLTTGRQRFNVRAASGVPRRNLRECRDIQIAPSRYDRSVDAERERYGFSQIKNVRPSFQENFKGGCLVRRERAPSVRVVGILAMLGRICHID